MKELDYIALIHREISGDITVAEQSQLQHWRNSAEENERLFQSVSDVWELSGEYEPDFDVDVNRAFNNQMSRIKEERIEVSPKVVRLVPRKLMYAAAACAAILLASVSIINNFSSKTFHAEGSTLEVQLADGSLILLNQGAELKVDRSFNDKHRNLSLKGEAYFDVAHNPEIPFNIDADDFSVTVLGTAFNVDTEDEQVSVERGLVEVSAENAVKVKAGESAVIKDESVSRNALSTNAFAWKTRKISFDDAPLTLIAKDLESYFGFKIILDDSIINTDCSYNMPEQENVSFETMMKLIAAGTDLEWSKKGDVVSFISIQCEE